MNFATLFSSGIRMALPLALAALGIFVSSKAGIVNMAMEGTMLVSCFFSVAFSYWTGNAFIGLIGGVVVAVLYSIILGLFTVKGRGNHVVCGVGLNFVAQGMTTVLLSIIFKSQGISPSVNSLPTWNLPGIGYQSPIFFVCIIAFVVVAILLNKTNFGLRLRSIGENPGSADSVGINIKKYQFKALIIAGILGGLAGSEMAIGQLGAFAKEMTAARGFIAYAAVIFGTYRIGGIACATLFLGLLDAFQMRAQTVYNIPGQFLIILPYLLTIILIPFIRSTKQPAAEGVVFVREK